jgi:hypothetical protein
MVKYSVALLFFMIIGGSHSHLEAAGRKRLEISPIRTKNAVENARLAVLEEAHAKLINLMGIIAPTQDHIKSLTDHEEVMLAQAIDTFIFLLQIQESDSELIHKYLNSKPTKALRATAISLVNLIETARTRRSISTKTH